MVNMPLSYRLNVAEHKLPRYNFRMADLLRSGAGDLVLSPQGDFIRATPQQETLQRVRERLRSFAFEWFLDEEGLPYIESLFSQKRPDPRMKAMLLLAVSETPGVSEVTAFEATLDTETRALSIEVGVRFHAGGAARETISVSPTHAPATASLQDALNSPLQDALNSNLRDLSA